MATDAGTQGFKGFEREGWHRQAPNYDDRAGRMTTEAVAPLLDAVGARPGMRLLDVCCGPGYLTAEAAARGLVAVGLDIAPAMVDLARGRARGAELRIGDAEALDFGDGSLDAAVCAFGLLHLAEPDSAVSEAFRVLRPGGAYAFTVWDGPERAAFLGLGMGAILAHADMTVPLPPGPPIFQMADRASTSAVLERAGFRDVAVREVPIAFRGALPDDAWDWFEKSTVRTQGVIARQTAEVQARIKAAVVEGARRYAVPGGVSIPSPALLFAAKKPVGGWARAAPATPEAASAPRRQWRAPFTDGATPTPMRNPRRGGAAAGPSGSTGVKRAWGRPSTPKPASAPRGPGLAFRRERKPARPRGPPVPAAGRGSAGRSTPRRRPPSRTPRAPRPS